MELRSQGCPLQSGVIISNRCSNSQTHNKIRMKSIISTFLCFCGSIPLELGISGRGLLDTKNQRLEQTAILLDLLDDDYGTIFDPGNCFFIKNSQGASISASEEYGP